MGRRLILNNGTIIEGGEAGYSSGNLWLWFTGWTLQQAAAVFFNPAATMRIVFQYGEDEDVYLGYTDCTGLSIDEDGRISVCLVKED